MIYIKYGSVIKADRLTKIHITVYRLSMSFIVSWHRSCRYYLFIGSYLFNWFVIFGISWVNRLSIAYLRSVALLYNKLVIKFLFVRLNLITIFYLLLPFVLSSSHGLRNVIIIIRFLLTTVCLHVFINDLTKLLNNKSKMRNKILLLWLIWSCSLRLDHKFRCSFLLWRHYSLNLRPYFHPFLVDLASRYLLPVIINIFIRFCKLHGCTRGLRTLCNSHIVLRI